MANIYGALWLSGFQSLNKLFGWGNDEDEDKAGFTQINSTNLVFKLHTVATVAFLFLASGLLQISKVSVMIYKRVFNCNFIDYLNTLLLKC